MKFPKSELQDMVYNDSERLEKIEYDLIGRTRWEIEYSAIFLDKSSGKHYKTIYRLPATEKQESAPYEYGPPEIECHEVHQVEKLVKVWEAVA